MSTAGKTPLAPGINGVAIARPNGSRRGAQSAVGIQLVKPTLSFPAIIVSKSFSEKRATALTASHHLGRMTADEEANARKHKVARRPFSADEDVCLMRVMYATLFHGWDAVARQLHGLTPRQCRERWMNYLAPHLRTDPWTEPEDELLLAKMNELGSAW